MTGCVSAAIIQKVIYFMIVFSSDRHRQVWVVWPSQSVYLFFSPKRLIVFLSVQINTFWSHKTLLRVGSLEEIIETKRERREREREREEECVCMGACACVCVREREIKQRCLKKEIFEESVLESCCCGNFCEGQLRLQNFKIWLGKVRTNTLEKHEGRRDVEKTRKDR